MRGPHFGIALLVAAVLTVLGAQPAGAAQACTSPAGASAFCVDFSFTASDNTAAAPFNFDVAVSNQSQGFQGDPTEWIENATLRLDQLTAGVPTVTSSNDLPNNLVIAGGTACTAPTYSTCAGGNGTVTANITSVFGDRSGEQGAFGISKIVNINPPGAGNYLRWRATIKACVNYSVFPGTCFQASDQTQDFVVALVSGGGPQPLAVTLDTRHQQTVSTGCCGSADVDYSLSSFSLHLRGASADIDGGSPLTTPTTILTMSKTCGTIQGTGTFNSGAPTRTVSIPQGLNVVGCPTAALQATASGLTAQLNGSGSAATVGGRTVAKYIWDFGDGTSAETTQPTTSHTYATGGAKTVTLRVEDSAGARSGPVQTQVTTVAPNPPVTKVATRTTVSARLRRGKVRIRGTVRPKTATGRVRIRLLRKKGRKFVLFKKTSKPLRNGAFSARMNGPRRTRRCKVIAIYPGDSRHKGSRRSKTFAC